MRGQNEKQSRSVIARSWRKNMAAAAILIAGTPAIIGCGSASATIRATRQPGKQVLLLPVLSGGAVGWCVTNAVAAGCPVARLKSGPIIAESWLTGGKVVPISGAASVERPQTAQAEGFAVTTADVASVMISGSNSIGTVSDPELPPGFRAVAVKVHGAWAPEVKVPSLFGRPPHEAPAGLPRFTPLDATGERVAQKNKADLPAIAELPGQAWHRPEGVPLGACELSARDLPGLVAKAGFVATRVGSRPGLLGRPFASCASDSYVFEGWPAVGAVLLDANHPGSPPGPFPAMTGLAGRPYVFQVLTAEGHALARRVPGAWIVVAKGRNQRQRLVVLEHLIATIHRGV